MPQLFDYNDMLGLPQLGSVQTTLRSGIRYFVLSDPVCISALPLTPPLAVLHEAMPHGLITFCFPFLSTFIGTEYFSSFRFLLHSVPSPNISRFQVNLGHIYAVAATSLGYASM